jgi:hypothetical protein
MLLDMSEVILTVGPQLALAQLSGEMQRPDRCAIGFSAVASPTTARPPMCLEIRPDHSTLPEQHGLRTSSPRPAILSNVT